MKIKLLSKAFEIFHSKKSSENLDEEPKICYIDTLPKDLIQVILSFLRSKKDLFRAMLVCKQWSTVCNKDNTIIWTNFIVTLKTHQDFVIKQKPAPRVCHTAVVHEDSMIIFGGHTGSTFSFGDVLNDCWRLHIPSRTWYRILANFVHNTEHTAVMHNNQMYIYGGYYKNYVDELYCYDFKEGSYTLVQVDGPKPKRRSACVAVIYNDCLYVYGGWDGIYGGNHNDMHYFDFNTKQWTEVKYASELVPPPLRSVNGAVYKDALYLHGGFGEDHPEGLYKFDFITKEWTIVKTTGNGPCGRSRSKLVGYKHKIYVMGGWDRKTYFDDYYEFNILTSTWTKMDVKGQAIGQHSMVVYHDTLYAFGGYSTKQEKPVNSVYMNKLSINN